MRWSRSVLVGIAVCGVVFSGPTVIADDDDVPQRVTVSFGGGLNTAAPGNRLNHHVLPRVVKVRTKAARGTRSAVPGVVDFMVSGFHQIFVYNPQITLQQIQVCAATKPFDPATTPPTNLFLNCNVNTTDLFYAGINPELCTPAGCQQAANLNAAGIGIPPFSPSRGGDENRVESVGFTTPGLYLVICNVNPHFTDRMYSWVRVYGEDDDDDDDDDDDHDHH
jgi:hypothetical protein